jgi:N-methylhydantoinase A/oxoprolinase/acetone carboxylase beta subunit
MSAVVVPARAGVLSAVGLLCSAPQRDLVQSWPTPALHAGLDDARVALATRAAAAVAGAVAGEATDVETTIDCRYAGQSHELTVTTVDEFHDEHRRRNGWARNDALVEVVALRARARRASALGFADLRPPATVRQPTSGPAVLVEADCTVWVPPGWHADVDEGGAWILRRSRS